MQYINPLISQIKRTIDGDNLTTILQEFGVRLHRVVFDHLQQFQFNTAGAMCAICDVNEYRKCARGLGSPLVTQLFDILHALCNLLLVKHENLQEVCCGDTLVRSLNNLHLKMFLIILYFRIIWINLLCWISFSWEAIIKLLNRFPTRLRGFLIRETIKFNNLFKINALQLIKHINKLNIFDFITKLYFLNFLFIIFN